MGRKIKILVAKPGLDGHDRGLKVVANALEDAGIEVIYLGIHQTPESIADAAAKYDVDGVAVSFLTGAHMVLLPRITKLLGKCRKKTIPLIVGGVIPDEDVKKLGRYKNIKVFAPGSGCNEIITYIKSRIKR